MSFDSYEKAQKLGLKAYKDDISHGRYPYLPVLDEILSHADIDGEIPLGTEDIPLNQVVGTCTFGRTQAFASNFMPLLEEDSEFACKWGRLAEAQETEGIRDAIKVYEYMNNYYVAEGNKRVSVLKYFNAPKILAQVTRKLPRRTDDPENKLYYEFVDFYRLTGINYVLFTKLGSYAKLLEAVEKSNTDIWTKEECLDFASFYAEFAKAFIEKRGDALKLTTADAMLFFLSLYPYKDVKNCIYAQIKKQLNKIWPEILLLAKEDSVELMMDPTAEKKPGTVEAMLQKLIPSKKRKVCFIYDKDPSASDWIYGHELGRLHLEEVMGDTVETYTCITNGISEEAELFLDDLCNAGCDIIFAVTPQLIKACLKVAVAHPNVTVLNCALYSSHSAVRTYYTRMYEAKFLTGMIAGSMCTNDKIGYVSDYPIYGAAASINAFALGARMVNPRAKVYLAWSTLKDFDMEEYFRSENITYISSQDMITPQNDNRQYGLYELTPEGKNNLALSIYHWGAFYEKLVTSIIRGSFKTEENGGENKAINYWWGVSADVIDVIYSQKLSIGTVQLIELMKQSISSGSFAPFTGPLTDQDGQIRLNAGETLKPVGIVKMDWLVDNVIGFIPTLDQLKEEAQPIVQLRGLYKTTADKGGSSIL